jgi:hypothetical protein
MGNPKRRKRQSGYVATEKALLEDRRRRSALVTRAGTLKLRKKAEAQNALLADAKKAIEKKVARELREGEQQADLLADAVGVAELYTDPTLTDVLYHKLRVNQLLEEIGLPHATREQVLKEARFSAKPKPKPVKKKRKRIKRNAWRKD